MTGTVPLFDAPDPWQPPARSGERLSRREWEVGPCRRADAAALVAAWHYLPMLTGALTYLHGLRQVRPAPAGPVVGAALWTPPLGSSARWAGDEVLVLSRLVLRPDAPRNAASFLLAGSVRLIDRARYPVLLSYADPEQGHEGRVYLAAGWEDAGMRPGADGWRSPAGVLVSRPRDPVSREPLRAAELRRAGWVFVPRRPKRAFLLR